MIEAEWSQAAERLTPRLIEEEQQQRDHEKKRRLEYGKRQEGRGGRTEEAPQTTADADVIPPTRQPVREPEDPGDDERDW